jgi:hypothetical protein
VGHHAIAASSSAAAAAAAAVRAAAAAGGASRAAAWLSGDAAICSKMGSTAEPVLLLTGTVLADPICRSESAKCQSSKIAFCPARHLRGSTSRCWLSTPMRMLHP